MRVRPAYHLVVPDGVFVADGANGELSLLRLRGPADDELRVRTFAINWQGEPTPMNYERFAALAIWNRRVEGKLEDDEHEAWKIMRSVGGSSGLEDTRTLVGESPDTVLSPGPMPGLQQRTRQPE